VCKAEGGASWLEFCVDVDSDSVPLHDVERELSVRSNGDSRSRTASTVLNTVNHITVRSSGKARLEARVPILIHVVNRHEPCIPASERDTLGSRREPVGHPVGLYCVPEPDHSGNGCPTMLAIPPVSPTVSIAGPIVSVWSALVAVTELVTGQNGGSAPWMSQNPNVGEGVDVVWGVDG